MSIKLCVGDPMPSVGLRATDGYLLNLRSWVTKQPVVLLFFGAPTLAGAARRKGQKAVEALVAGYDRLREAGIAVAAVSCDSEQQQAEFVAAHKLPFLLLSDERRSAVEMLGIETVANGENVNVAQPVAIAVDRDGIIRAVIEPRRAGGAGRPVIRALSEPIPAADRRRRRLVLSGRPMRAVRLHAPGEPLRVETSPCPSLRAPRSGSASPAAGSATPTCTSSTAPSRGSSCRVTLGHEVAGWIDAVGPEAERLLRRLRPAGATAVVVSRRLGLRRVRSAVGRRAALRVLRAPGFQADGGYAEPMLVPHPRHLVPLRRLDPVRAAPLADAGVTPYRAVRRAEPWLVAGARVLVIGCGALGQFALQLLRLVPPDGPRPVRRRA